MNGRLIGRQLSQHVKTGQGKHDWGHAKKGMEKKNPHICFFCSSLVVPSPKLSGPWHFHLNSTGFNTQPPVQSKSQSLAKQGYYFYQHLHCEGYLCFASFCHFALKGNEWASNIFEASHLLLSRTPSVQMLPNCPWICSSYLLTGLLFIPWAVFMFFTWFIVSHPYKIICMFSVRIYWISLMCKVM